MSVQMFLIVCPLVFLAGLVDAIAGGGGLISLPAYFIAGVPPHIALGTNKLSSSIGTAVSTIRYCRGIQLSVPAAVVSILMSLIGSALGSSLAMLAGERLLRSLLLCILPFVALVVLTNRRMGSGEERLPPASRLLPLMGGIAFLIGGYDGFYGPGTGTFLLLLFIGVCGMGVRRASAYTKIVNLSSNFAALSVFLLHGKLYPTLGLCAAVFSIAGHYAGSSLVLKQGARAVRPVVIAVLVLLFIKLITG